MRIRIFSALLVPALALGLGACTVDQTEEGEMPDVEGGNLPEYDVDAADVDIDMDTTTIRTPTIDVNTPPDTTS